MAEIEDLKVDTRVRVIKSPYGAIRPKQLGKVVSVEDRTVYIQPDRVILDDPEPWIFYPDELEVLA